MWAHLKFIRLKCKCLCMYAHRWAELPHPFYILAFEENVSRFFDVILINLNNQSFRIFLKFSFKEFLTQFNILMHLWKFENNET